MNENTSLRVRHSSILVDRDKIRIMCARDGCHSIGSVAKRVSEKTLDARLLISDDARRSLS